MVYQGDFTQSLMDEASKLELDINELFNKSKLLKIMNSYNSQQFLKSDKLTVFFSDSYSIQMVL